MRCDRRRLSRLAVSAQAEHGEMPDIGAESRALFKRHHKGLYGCLVNLGHPLAPAADQVHVLSVLGEVIGRRPVVQVAVFNQAKLLEQLERPVYGRDVDAASGLPDLAVDFFRSCVLQPLDCLKDELALRGDAVAASPERIVPRLRHNPSLVTPGR
jgi:hypothetical protein